VAEEHTYAAAGVSLATAEAIVERLRRAVASTATPAVAGNFGAFAGLYALDERRLLAATTDSVGTKLMLAREHGRLRDAGADLAAHCINDVLTTGAEPLFFLDYVAANSIDVQQVAELVEGAADVCREAGCAILGGETAELPGIYKEGELDFAGTCVGVVERDRMVDGSRVQAGDAIVGLASNGVHANGFSLVRQVLEVEPYGGDDLLAPTRLYLDDVRTLMRLVDVHAFAHITGGGLLGNLSRVLPEGLRAEIYWDRIAELYEQPVFRWLSRHVGEEEMRRVFNLGVGFCAIHPHRGESLVIGRVVAA
jgi:phosphoribosylformylglycinamidine cyclo-ligase